METTKLMPVLTLPTSDGLSVNVPISSMREITTYKCRTTLLTTDDQVITLACTTVQVKLLWIDILFNLAEMGVKFSQMDYGILPLLSETEEKQILTSGLESNLVVHEYAHGDALQQWANEDRLRLLEILKERRADSVQ